MIKKFHISCFALTFLLTIFPLSAKVGIKAGPALSDVIYAQYGQTPYLSYEINSLTHRLPYLTYQFGVYKSFNISTRFSVQPEILFVKKGLNYSMDFIYDDITYLIKINYVEVPFMLKYDLTKSKRTAMLIGPYFSYMINTKRIREIEGTLVKDEMDNIKKVDFGIATSIARNFGDHFNIDLRLTYSLIEMMDYLEGVELDFYGPDKERARNVNLSLTVGYLLPIGNKS